MLTSVLVEQVDVPHILHLVATTAPALARCQTYGIVLDGRWHERSASDLGGSGVLEERIGSLDPAHGGRLSGPDDARAWAYSLSNGRDISGFLVVCAEASLTALEQFLLQALARQAGVAVANAALHTREREHAEELRTANRAIGRSMAIHERLTRVVLAREGAVGIARVVHDLSGLPTAIEDGDGNLWAWAGPGRPAPYPRQPADRRDAVLRVALAAESPVRDGARLISVARVGDDTLAVLALIDAEERSGDTERVILEHATTVLTMELARVRSQTESESRQRADLVVEILGGTDEIGALDRARTLHYDLGRPHWVVIVQDHFEGDTLLHAVRRAARDERIGSLLAARSSGVVLFADAAGDWVRFYDRVVGELQDDRIRIGVGGRCDRVSDYVRSYWEAEHALKLQSAVSERDRVTVFADLGVYQLFCALPDQALLEHLVERWLGVLLDYDATNGSQLTATLNSYLESGASYDGAARNLAVHRSTLKYRLGRIREISGFDLRDPDTRFNLELATRAWRAQQALGTP